MKYLIIFLILYSTSLADTLHLGRCYREASNAYPNKKQIELQKAIAKLKTQNLNSAYLPEILLSGQAKYQSDVTTIPIKVPSITIPEIPHDTYQLLLNVNQMIWDGGLSDAQKVLTGSQYNIDSANIEVDLYKLYEKVNSAYFAVLLLQEKLNSLLLLQSDIAGKLEEMNVRVAGGVILQSNADILTAELIKIKQSIIEVKSNIRVALDMLGKLIDEKLTDSTILALPDEPSIDNEKNFKKRPEFNALDKSKTMLDESKKLTDAKYNPKFSAFLQGGYSKPGLDMFNPDFKPYLHYRCESFLECLELGTMTTVKKRYWKFRSLLFRHKRKHSLRILIWQLHKMNMILISTVN